ncbi:esterase FE4-like [Sitophilus oryzae]|uniref:Esterase FE4-like n=1 Tax=Sitophilus oryzae TaxID=7048 RepID=A0A6J2XEA6_SITOR|nr:esterase FE4-like [Sitophilus oryzae]
MDVVNCFLYLLISTLTLINNAVSQREPLVTVAQGSLRGLIKNDQDGNKFYSFTGIPYAKPPVGPRRFKVSEPPSSWDGVRNATVEGSACLQYDDTKNTTVGKEDCLYLNVYTRDLPDKGTKPKPVMFWIHGGSFISGDGGSFYGPDFLLTQDIVLVTVNYRLGFLGYIQAKGIPGNLGFKDQIVAMKWVKNNIRVFNGDPNQVTIFGESSGSASVHYHVLSPLTRGLFQRAILESGTALNPWGDYSYHDIVKVAKTANPSITTEEQAAEYFRNLPSDEILRLQNTITSSRNVGGPYVFALNIEKPSRDAFISRNIIDILTSGEYNKVPLLIGFNDREGILDEVVRELENETVTAKNFIPHNIDFHGNETLRQIYIKKFNDFYLSTPDRDSYIKAYSDTMFVAGIFGTVKNHIKTCNKKVFLYKFAGDTGLNYIKVAVNVTDIPGASHGDELGYLFKTTSTPNIQPGSVEDKSWRRMVKLWTNFAKYGNPTPNASDLGVVWTPVDLSQWNLLHIENSGLTMKSNTETRTIEFWADLYHQSRNTINYL